jgi:predicted AAA+ superfamily ATPase
MVRILPPWFENISKRQVKAPKIYLRDSGMLHALLQLPTRADVQGHPKLGASWEGFAMEQCLALLETKDHYFWATYSGAELDLLVMIGGKRYGFEFKYSDAPGHTRSMSVAIQDLKLEHLWVVYPGDQEYPLEEKISVMPISSLTMLAEKIRKGAKAYRRRLR